MENHEVERDLHEDPTFTIACLFHSDLALLARTLPRCLSALSAGTSELFEVVLHCDGTPAEVLAELTGQLTQWGVDELRFRDRRRFVASGDPSNNGHRRLFGTRSRYLIVFEDDVVMYRDAGSFDVLGACRSLFERHSEIVAICKVDDFDVWAWKLEDVGAPIEAGVRSVNRVATHFIAYDLDRFMPVAHRFGAFDRDVFIDRTDMSYNWEDIVSHVGTTGGRRIAFPAEWPLHVFHCDRKVADGSMYSTQDPSVKQDVLNQLEEQFSATGGKQ
jgi:hypothetical protein